MCCSHGVTFRIIVLSAKVKPNRFTSTNEALTAFAMRKPKAVGKGKKGRDKSRGEKERLSEHQVCSYTVRKREKMFSKDQTSSSVDMVFIYLYPYFYLISHIMAQ